MSLYLLFNVSMTPQVPVEKKFVKCASDTLDSYLPLIPILILIIYSSYFIG